MKKNLNITKPRYSEHILPVPWPFPLASASTVEKLKLGMKICSRLS